MLPDLLVLSGLSLRCVVIERETSSDFMPPCLCLCQVQAGSGCRRLAINATAVKANAVSGWLKLQLHLSERVMCRRYSAVRCHLY